MVKILFIVLSIMLLSACGIVSDKFTLDPGLDGCVHVQMKNFSGGPVHADEVSYHRVNEKCKDMQYHGTPSPEVS